MSEDDWSGLAFDADGRLVDLKGATEVITYGPPPPMGWVAAADLPRVFGRRACHMPPSGPVFDLRCASDVYESNGGHYVNVVSEAQWYRWLELDESDRPEQIPRAVSIGARHIWVEVVNYSAGGASGEDGAGR